MIIIYYVLRRVVLANPIILEREPRVCRHPWAQCPCLRRRPRARTSHTPSLSGVASSSTPLLSGGSVVLLRRRRQARRPRVCRRPRARRRPRVRHRPWARRRHRTPSFLGAAYSRTPSSSGPASSRTPSSSGAASLRTPSSSGAASLLLPLTAAPSSLAGVERGHCCFPRRPRSLPLLSLREAAVATRLPASRGWSVTTAVSLGSRTTSPLGRQAKRQWPRVILLAGTERGHCCFPRQQRFLPPT